MSRDEIWAVLISPVTWTIIVFICYVASCSNGYAAWDGYEHGGPQAQGQSGSAPSGDSGRDRCGTPRR
jgi:hypothetical protein